MTLQYARAWIGAAAAAAVLGLRAGLAVAGQAACIPPLADTLRIDEWSFLGPFSVGAREGIIGVVEEPGALTPAAGIKAPSMLAQGGYVTWRQARADSSGWVDIEFEDVLWDTLMDVYGYAGIVVGAYAHAEITMPEAARALVSAERIGTFYLNGRLHLGDPYGHGYTRIPVVLQQGLNRIVLNLTGFADRRFKFEILPPPAAVITLEDYTVPDIRVGEDGPFWIGVPLLNTTPAWIGPIRLKVGGGMHTVAGEQAVAGPAPFCVKKIPVRVELTRPLQGLESQPDEIRIPLEVCAAGDTFTDTVTLRVRQPDQSFRRTFISSIDKSCQYYAVLPPSDYDPESRYAVILSLHGANVMAEGQVDAYKPKPWAFVVAPTNRRRYGFDWQDWGRLDALQVLEHVKASLPTDENRVYLTGHSMGGHGAWHVGLTHPDLFAALAPAAGWTSFELYVPWFLQKAYVYGSPEALAVRDRALRQDWPLWYVENALNLPTFVLQGGSDDNVPPVHARMFVERFEDLGYRHSYKEDPGRGHWYGIDSLGVSCVDDPDLIGFLPDKVRDPLPRHVVFKTMNVSHTNRAYWIEILEQEKLYQPSQIEARVDGSTIEVITQNVGQFRIRQLENLVPAGPVSLVVDGRRLTVDAGERRAITLAKRGGSFRLGSAGPQEGAKTPDLHGPIKQAYFSPFVLVYGTQGERRMTDLLLHQARLEAFQWWRRGNGLVEVLPDTALTREVIDAYNLILFGGPDRNAVTRSMNRHLPIRLAGDKVYFDGRKVAGEEIGVKFVYPNPLNPERLVVIHEGTGPGGDELSTFFRALSAGAGLPDFMIFDRRVRRRGWAGMIAAGFFNSDWRVDRDLMYVEGIRW